MQITKAVYDQIAPGEIFWIVTTRLHIVRDYPNASLTFVCVKAKTEFEGRCLWAIYGAPGTSTPDDIARYGSKVRDKEQIQFVCPCDEEVLALYRK